MSKIKIVAVSYLNTKPLLFGLQNSSLWQHIDLQLQMPSVCAEKLLSGEVEIGLVPVAIIPQLATPHLFSDYCIGAEGKVRTVCIYSNVPLEKISKLYLDYQSKTSIELVKILLDKHWKCAPQLLPASKGFEEKIIGDTAALIIGDRTMELEHQFPYIYDLAEAWKSFTGLPFVFAAWVSNRPLPDELAAQFNAAFAWGIRHIPQLLPMLDTPISNFNLEEYFTKNISYHLTVEKQKALNLFLSYLSERN